jgi:hypothetical protein
MDRDIYAQATSAEDYARRRLELISADERAGFGRLSDEELLQMFEGEFYTLAEEESGELEIENAEIELHLSKEKGQKPN